jgi:L-fuconolactonase
MAAAESLTASLDDPDRAAVFGGNAARIYLAGRGRSTFHGDEGGARAEGS